jgi:hypothetical protein
VEGERSHGMLSQQQSTEGRNKARTRKGWKKVEQYLTQVEKSDGCAKAWELRQRLEAGHVTLEELKGRR